MNKNLLTVASLSLCTCLTSIANAQTAELSQEVEPVSTLSETELLSGAFESFSASLGAGYESEYIFRGKKLSNSIATASADAGYDIGAGFGVYAGWWGAYGVQDSYQENDLYAGITYSIENLTVDVGYIGYLYPSGGNENEMQVMLSYDTAEYLGEFAINPYIAMYYQDTYNGFAYEGGLSYSAPVTSWLIGQEWGTLDLGLYAGAVDSEAGEYFYTGLSLDACVAINDYWSFSIGMRYAYNDDAPAGAPGDDGYLWFGCGTSIGF